MSKVRAPQKSLTFAEKVAIIREVEKGLNKKGDIAKKFGIPPSTLSTFLKNKDKILSENSSQKDRKRARGPENPDVDACVLKWFSQVREKNVPVSGTILRAKAEEFAGNLGKSEFKASTGWLDGFKERNAISFKTICGESGSVDNVAVDRWVETLKNLIRDTAPKNIFNADETGLFFKCTPDKTLAFKGDTCKGGKNSKERVTILIGANMDGSERLPLLMIGKSQKPRCFKNVQSVPIEYRANKKAWMTSELFKEWLVNLDKTMFKEKRKILLFVDNCTAHNSIPEMESVKVIFFPPNMTSVIQPMDQGVIKNFKHFYRRLIVEKIADDCDFKNINILDASRMCFNAWEQVTTQTIANCFKKAGFGGENVIVEEEASSSIECDTLLLNAGVSFEDFQMVDENLAVCGELSDEDIIQEVQKTSPEDSSDEEDHETAPPPTTSKMIANLAEMRRILYSYNVRILGILGGLLLSAVILDAIATALGERKASSGGSKRGAASNANSSQTAPQLREAVERVEAALKSVTADLTHMRNTNHAQFCALVCGGITSLWLAMWLGGGVLWHGLLSGLLLMPLVIRGHAESDGEVDEFLPEISSVLLKELNAVHEQVPDPEEHSSMLLDLSLPPDAVLRYAPGDASSSEDEGDGKGPPSPDPPSTDTTDSDSEFLIKDKRKKSNPNEKQNPGGRGFFSTSSLSPSAPPQQDSDSDEFEIVNKDDL